MDSLNQQDVTVTKHFDFPRPHLSLPALHRHRRSDAVVSRGSLELGAAGVIALGAFAIGAIAIGALAINRLAIRRARIERLSIGTLRVGRLIVEEQNEPEDELEDEPEGAAAAA